MDFTSFAKRFLIVITHLSAFLGGVLITLLLTWRTGGVTTPQKQDIKQYRAQSVLDEPASGERGLRSKTNESPNKANEAKTEISKVEQVTSRATRNQAKRKDVDIDNHLTRLINTIPDSLIPRYERDFLRDEKSTTWALANLVGKEFVSQMQFPKKLERNSRRGVSEQGGRRDLPFDHYVIHIPRIPTMYFGDDINPRFWLKDKTMGIYLELSQGRIIVPNNEYHPTPLTFDDENVADKIANLLKKNVVNVTCRISSVEIRGAGTGCAVYIRADVIAIDDIPIPDLSDRFVR